MVRVQSISPELLGRWRCQALEQAVPSSAEHAEIKRPRAELKRVEMERDVLKKRCPSLGVVKQLGKTSDSTAKQLEYCR